MGNIKNREAHKNTRVDWDFLNQIFRKHNSNIKVSDLDGCTERHGNLLFLEHESPWNDLTEGQYLLHKNAVKNNQITSIVFWAELDKSGHFEKVEKIQTFSKKGINFQDTDKYTVEDLVEIWFKIVNKKGF